MGDVTVVLPKIREYGVRGISIVNYSVSTVSFTLYYREDVIKYIGDTVRVFDTALADSKQNFYYTSRYRDGLGRIKKH
jgi:hypothetical protein